MRQTNGGTHGFCWRSRKGRHVGLLPAPLGIREWSMRSIMRSKMRIKILLHLVHCWCCLSAGCLWSIHLPCTTHSLLTSTDILLTSTDSLLTSNDSLLTQSLFGQCPNRGGDNCNCNYASKQEILPLNPYYNALWVLTWAKWTPCIIREIRNILGTQNWFTISYPPPPLPNTNLWI